MNARTLMNGSRAAGDPMNDPRGRALGGMVRDQSVFGAVEVNEHIREDGRPTPQWRESLRRIPNFRNMLTVVMLYAQTLAIIYMAVHFNHWAIWVLAFVLMGRAHAQYSSLMHEAAHRSLFSNKTLNDFVGRWLLGFPVFVSTDAYRRVHMAHHRQEFGPDEPDIPLYAGYPISPESFRRKMLRDATGQTGFTLLRGQLQALRSPNKVIRNTMSKMIAVQVVLFAVSIALGHPFVYLLLWALPWFTIWRVINRLRAIAEHGGLRADPDRRNTTHSIRQHLVARFFMVPYNIGFHIAHHVDAGVPFRSLPKLHRELVQAGFVTRGYEYPSYRSFWRAARTANA